MRGRVRRPPGGLAALGVTAALAACAGAPHPVAALRAPRPEVRAELDRAEAAERLRRHDETRRHYQAAVALAVDPTSAAVAHREFADTLMSWGELDAAIAELHAVTVVAPGAAAAWHDLGVLRHQRHDDAGAVTALERARDLAPRDLRPRIALAALRWATGDRGGAAREYEAILPLDPPPRLRGKIEWALGQLAAK